jgi:hypothetical protein
MSADIADTKRIYWLEQLSKLVTPLLKAGKERILKEVMPIEAFPDRKTIAAKCTHLEAVGRLLCGIAPWLALEELDGGEADFQATIAQQARETISSIVDPKSPDFLNFNEGTQPLVDAAFLAQAILRAPKQLWALLDETAQANLIIALKSTRNIRPHFNNWLLFSATIEALFCKLNLDWDKMRVDYAIRQHEQWYIGDGHYSDGDEFHSDYYNSYVIQPMLLDVLDCVSKKDNVWNIIKVNIEERAKRYAVIQERTISPTGTFPPIGRSLTYRGGAFHLLAQMSYKEQLPNEITPAQVRGALEAVMAQTLDVDGTYDDLGWLKIGLHGHQPLLGERYISTGSLYLCSTIFLPLGLTPSSSFWSLPDEPWTQRKVWWHGSNKVQADVALKK